MLHTLGVRRLVGALGIGYLLIAAPLLSVPAVAKTEIQFWTPWGGAPWFDMQKQIVASFNASQSDIEVQLVAQPNGEIVKKATLVNDPPDVVALFGFGVLSAAPSGAWLPLDQLIQRDLDTADFVPASLKQFTWNGETWGASFGAAANALVYNQRDFSDAGVAQPAGTLEALATQAKKLIKVDAEGRLQQIAWNPLDMWGGLVNFADMFGADWYDPTDQTVTVDTPEVRNALNWLKTYFDENHGYADVQSGGFSGLDAFVAGKTAMTTQHSWYLGLLLQQKLGYPAQFGVAPLPLPGGPGGRRGPLFATDGIAIPARTTHPEAAWTFFKWLMTEGQREWADIQGIDSAWRPSTTRWQFELPASVHETYINSLALARPVPPIPVVDQLMSALGKQTIAMLLGKVSPDNVVRTVQHDVQVALDTTVGKQVAN